MRVIFRAFSCNKSTKCDVHRYTSSLLFCREKSWAGLCFLGGLRHAINFSYYKISSNRGDIHLVLNSTLMCWWSTGTQFDINRCYSLLSLFMLLVFLIPPVIESSVVADSDSWNKFSSNRREATRKFINVSWVHTHILHLDCGKTQERMVYSTNAHWVHARALSVELIIKERAHSRTPLLFYFLAKINNEKFVYWRFPYRYYSGKLKNTAETSRTWKVAMRLSIKSISCSVGGTGTCNLPIL